MKWDSLERNAVGACGTYHVQPGQRDGIGMIWWLHARHHDGLLFLAISDGRPFPTASAARGFADQLDLALTEAQASGA